LENSKKDIRSLSKDEIIQFFDSHGIPSFRGKQVYQWLWQKGVHDFDAMTNLALVTKTIETNIQSKRNINKKVLDNAQTTLA